MDQSNDIKALMAMANAHALVLNKLCTSLFSTNREMRKAIPEALVGAAMFQARLPAEVMEEENWIDIQARSVLYLQAFFAEIEGQMQRHDEAESEGAS